MWGDFEKMFSSAYGGGLFWFGLFLVKRNVCFFYGFLVLGFGYWFCLFMFPLYNLALSAGWVGIF